MEQQQVEANVAVHPSGRPHPTPAAYVTIALILAVITAVEVGIIYVGMATAALYLLLFILSISKFTMVAMFFMHLRFDAPLFSLFFVGGLILATSVMIALLSLFRVLI